MNDSSAGPITPVPLPSGESAALGVRYAAAAGALDHHQYLVLAWGKAHITAAGSADADDAVSDLARRTEASLADAAGLPRQPEEKDHD